MKKKAMAKISEATAMEFNRIVAGTTIKGDVESNGDIRIDGCLVGTLTSKAKVILGPTAIVEGEIVCKNADIQGQVKANVRVEELLSLKSTAKVFGDITTNKLAIEAGAEFSGKCNMGGQQQLMNSNGHEQRQEKQKRELVT